VREPKAPHERKHGRGLVARASHVVTESESNVSSGMSHLPTATTVSLKLPLKGVQLWTAENPFLYTLVYTTTTTTAAAAGDDGATDSVTGSSGSSAGAAAQRHGSTTSATTVAATASVDDSSVTDGDTVVLQSESCRVGFRAVRITEGLLRVNGIPLIVNGVNRHEHDERGGKAVRRYTAVQDVLLLKVSTSVMYIYTLL
jgi:Glycosyl hydrolases family 2, TIM barrel domain